MVLDRLPYGVDPAAVLRAEVAGLLAERAGDVAAVPGEPVQVVEHLGQPDPVDLVGIGADVAASQHLGVRRHVGRRDVQTATLELLGHPGGAGEEVERGAGLGRSGDAAEDRDEQSLGTEVLDHQLSPLSGITRPGLESGTPTTHNGASPISCCPPTGLLTWGPDIDRL
jgi:hypothetical protein